MIGLGLSENEERGREWEEQEKKNEMKTVLAAGVVDV